MSRVGIVSLVSSAFLFSLLVSSLLIFSASPLASQTAFNGFMPMQGGDPGRSPTAIPCTDIGDNGVITENTTLTNDLYSNVNYSTCIEISANDVTLDCDGHSIINDGSWSRAVRASDVSNVTVRNCNTASGGLVNSVEFRNVNGGEINNNNFYNGSNVINLGGSNNVLVTRNTFKSDTNSGSAFGGAGTGNVIEDNLFDLTGSGWQGGGPLAVNLSSDGNFFVDNVFLGNPITAGAGIYSTSEAQGNLIENNSFSGFSVGIGLFSVFERGNAENVVRGNLFENNQIGIYVIIGDLNQIYGNTLQNNGAGFIFEEDNYNNIIYDNDIYDSHNE